MYLYIQLIFYDPLSFLFLYLRLALFFGCIIIEMKTNSYLCLLLSLFFIIPLRQSAWVVYDQFSGYIPSYIYPVTVNAGDVITATLSWPGS